VLTPQQAEIELEKKSQRLLGMSLAEFRERVDTGEIPDTPAVDHMRFLLDV
jgi:hypothetical protein